MATADSTAGAPGAAFYTTSLLWFYDVWVLGLSNALAWRCSTRATLQPFFQAHLSASHIDIGVGTGYFPAHAAIPAGAALTLVDLNPNSLALTARRVRVAHPDVDVRTVQADILSPTSLFASCGPADSVSVFYLVHCLTGPVALRAAALVRLRGLLTPEGVLYGSTVLGRGVEHNLFGRLLMAIYNRIKIFDNIEDGVEDFVQPLREHFHEVQYEVKGTVLLFAAKKPRQDI